MKRTIIFTVCLLAAARAVSQANYTATSENPSVKYYVGNNGTFFNNPATGTSGYLVPKDSLTGALYLMGLEALGTDPNGQLIGAVGYDQSDFFPGPIATDYDDPGYTDRYQFSIWPMTKALVDHHIGHWQDVGYVPSGVLLAWPGNGNTANGEAAVIAPFFDADNDLVYEPASGDYPLIRGDIALFAVVNDRADVHPSGMQPIGMEAHLLFYQYTLPGQPVITNTTFIHATLINRGTVTCQDFHFGSFVDFDLGNPHDDYIGTMPDKNLAYVYNSDSFDETMNGIHGYGLHPPAAGIVTLGRPLYSHVPITGAQPPFTPNMYYNLLRGYLASGASLTDDNGQPTRYAYTETGAAGWNEHTQNNPSGDRRTNISFGSEFFLPGDILCYDYAIVYAHSAGGLFASADSLGNVADEVTAFFEDQEFTCLQAVLETDEILLPDFTLFPNPATEQLTVELPTAGTFRILAPDGKKILWGSGSGTMTVDIGALADGYYIFVFTTPYGAQTKSFVKR